MWRTGRGWECERLPLCWKPIAVGQAISGIPNDMPWWRVLRAGWIIPEKPKELYLARIALLENEGFRKVHLQVPHNRSWSP